MIARPATAALSCRQCQTAIFRAVLSSAAPSIRTLPQRQVRQLPILTRRLYSSGNLTEKIIEKEATEVPGEAKEEEEDRELHELAETLDEVPWFLEEEAPRHAPSQHAVTLPTVPEGAPEVLESMIKYIYEDMGLDDIALLDLRDLDPPAALGPSLIMLFGTARSERHLHISSGRLQRWLKRQHSINARADGLIGPGELKTKLRRLRKKAKLMGTNTAIIPGGDNGISTGWVCVNFSSDTNNVREAVSYDDSGRFSGFGQPQTGTTVVMQCMTEARREELDLEKLWKGILKRNLKTNQTVKGENVDDAQVEALLAARVQIPTHPGDSQWEAIAKASEQHRYYSTSARRLSSVAESGALEEYLRIPGVLRATDIAKQPGKAEASSPLMLDQVQKHVQDIQLVGIPFTPETMYHLIRAIFKAESKVETAAAQRLSLVDQVLLTAEERGMKIWSTETFIVLVEAVSTSPSYGPELKRAQTNLEYLLTREGERPSDEQILRLMGSYAQQGDWDMFWDAFRIPSRFNAPRSVQHYDLAYRVMAATGSDKLCTSALRHVYPEMVTQDPPINPIGSIYQSLKACIRVADPAAEHLITNPPTTQGWSASERARHKNREMFKVLWEVEKLRVSALRSMGDSERDWDMELALDVLEAQRVEQMQFEEMVSRSGSKTERTTERGQQKEQFSWKDVMDSNVAETGNGMTNADTISASTRTSQTGSVWEKVQANRKAT